MSVAPNSEQFEQLDTFCIPPIYSASSNELDFENLLRNSDSDSAEFDLVDETCQTLRKECSHSAIAFEADKQSECFLGALDSGDENSSLEWMCTVTDLSKREKLQLIQEEINRLKAEQERMDEQDMMTCKWRFILERKRRLELRRRELCREDEIDAQAYLNEIEMNLDYFMHEDLENEREEDYNFAIDQMLKFRTNTMAFNLRNYHKHVTDHKVNTA